jgi:hypothetical protein
MEYISQNGRIIINDTLETTWNEVVTTDLTQYFTRENEKRHKEAMTKIFSLPDPNIS